MALTTQIASAITRMGTEFKSIRSAIGSLTGLNTTHKDTIVGAINEVRSMTTSAGAQIDDNATATDTVWSSSKVAGITGGLRTDVDANTAAIGSKASINDATPSGGTTYSGTKIEALVATEVATRPVIDDTAISETAVWSSVKTDSEIDGAIAELVDGAPEVLNTLREISEALQDNPDVIADIEAALGFRVRVDAAQSFTAPQRAQGRDNIGAIAAAAIGDTETDFVAVFEAAIA